MRPNANVLAGVASIDGYDGGVQITERWAGRGSDGSNRTLRSICRSATA